MAEHTIYGSGEAASGYGDDESDTNIVTGQVFRNEGGGPGYMCVGARFVPPLLAGSDKWAYLWRIEPSPPHVLLAAAPLGDLVQNAWNRVDWDEPVEITDGAYYAIGIWHPHGGFWVKPNRHTTDSVCLTDSHLKYKATAAVASYTADPGAGNGFYWQPTIVDPANPPPLDMSTFSASGYLVDVVIADPAILAAPANTAAPSVVGSTGLGDTLTCLPGTWTGTPPPTFTYQWRRGAAGIAGATAETYTLVEADVGQVIDCLVTATNSQGSSSADSADVTGTLPRAQALLYRRVGSSWQEVTLAAAGGSGGVRLYQRVVDAGGLASFDTGVLDLEPYETVEIRARLRSDNNSIYDEPFVQFNGDTNTVHYATAAEGGNPHSPAGHFSSARWNGSVWFNGVITGAAPAGLLLGYATGAQAQAGYFSEWTAQLMRPSEAYLPKTMRSECRFIENRSDAHATILNGPEVFNIAGFWMPDAPTAINRIFIYPGFGTKFLQGSLFEVIGYGPPAVA